jgi:hypothetical protein
MNFETLEKAWGKQTVTAAAVPVETVIVRLKGEVQSARRRFRGAMVMAVGLLLLGWAVTLAAHVTGIKTITALGFIAQVVGSALYVALLLRARYSDQVAREEIAQMGGTLRASIAATLRTVELQIQNARLAANAIPLVVAITAWLYLAKYFAGEFPDFGVVWGTAATAVLGLLIGAAIWHRYRTQLAPRRAELRETLRTLEAETPVVS